MMHLYPPGESKSKLLGRNRISTASTAALAAVMVPALAIAEGSRAADPVFKDVTREAGISFVQTIGDDAMTNIVEASGVGCGFLDYDNDGHLDIYFVNGCWRQGISDPKLPRGRGENLASATDRLYRNRGDGTFENVTASAGLAQPGYGMAVVAADYDGDGDTDIYVTNHGPNFLYRNNGDGTFTDVAPQAGVVDPQFSIGATFLDFDRDGFLDLYVGNYLTYVDNPKEAHHFEGARSPLAYEGQQDHLYRNRGDGTFENVTQRAGIAIEPVGRAMGVGALDYDGDGRLDVFVSNDAMENFLFRNQGDGTFENEALMAGVAFSETGDAAAAMAVEVADVDGDGKFDILVPDMNLCCLYRNLGAGLFEDASIRWGLGRAMTGLHNWGGVLADFNLDGTLDMYVTSGSACVLEAQPDRLFTGEPNGRFRMIGDANRSANPAGNFVSRGVARSDYDNDGDLDLLVAHLNARPTLLRNETPREGRHWLAIQLQGKGGNRDAIGAVVKVSAGGKTLVQSRLSAGSYLSQHDHRLYFGLGEAVRIDLLEVTWPDGSSQTLPGLAADRLIRIVQNLHRPGRPVGG